VPAIDDGQLYTYAARPEELAAYIRVQRERFTNGDVRIAEIKERGHDWIMSPDEWRGQTVIALVEKLPPALVNGRPRGTMECYLDPGTRRLVGMAQRGPAPEGGRVESSVDVIEYGSAIPLDVFEAHWRGEAKISEGTYQVRPSGDIAFRPGESAAMHSRLGGAAERLHNAHVGAVPWDEVEQNYLRVHQEDPDNYEARMYLGRMYTRWGRFEEALALLPSDDGYWGDLNRAFCLDALGRRQEAVAIYDRLIKGELGPDNSVGAWALRGLERPTWPQDLDVSPEPGEARLKPGAKWTASSSSATAETKAAAAIDGNPVTSWSSGASQRVGQWLQIDFGSPVAVSRVLMDSWGPKTFVNNWPRGLRTSYSVDGRTWVSIAVAQAGPATGATLRLDPSVPVQAIRFEITKPVSPEWWGINELCVFGPAR
jgi:tetratricopeptide (TPR) repeat protein